MQSLSSDKEVIIHESLEKLHSIISKERYLNLYGYDHNSSIKMVEKLTHSRNLMSYARVYITLSWKNSLTYEPSFMTISGMYKEKFPIRK